MSEVREKSAALPHERCGSAASLLAAVAFVAEQTLSDGPLASSLPAVVARIGEAADADRACLFEVHTDEQGARLTSQRCAWTAPGIAPRSDLCGLLGPLPGGAPELVSRVRVRHDGFFETNMLGSGRYRLIARGYHEDDDGRIGVSPPIEAGTRDVRLAVRRGQSLSGVVRDASGVPVDGARVGLRGPATARRALSARDGTFRFRCLLPGRYRLRASVAGPPAAAVEREVAPGGPDVVLVVGAE